jgi:hypothetical protein
MADADSPTNREIADTLVRVADLLEERENNVFRIRSYRHAATVLRELDRPVAELFEQAGSQGLERLHGIGPRLAGAIREVVETGRLRKLDQLEAEVRPETVLAKVPGIGQELAERIHHQLEIESLEELERAAHDGRLANVEGFGSTRVRGVRDALAGMLTRSAARRARKRQQETEPFPGPEREDKGPSVATLLDVDAEYREKSAADELRKIAPRRFNPQGKAWLPVMRTGRGDWSFTAVFSNTAQAHELGKTRDWVVVYYQRDGREDQCTVVTAGQGELRGKRVVRGREEQCRRHYAV